MSYTHLTKLAHQIKVAKSEDRRLVLLTGAERDAMQARVKELEAQLKNEQNRKRNALIGVGVGIPTILGASMVYDKLRKR